MEDHQVYKISEELGIFRKQKIDKGTYGDVYKGFDMLNQRDVALKHIKDKYWEQQISTLKIMNHDNIVKYYGHIPNSQIRSQNNGQGAYIIMEYVNGQTLRNMLKSKEFGGNGLPETTVLKIFRQLLSGFSYMHSKGIVHRDIKPENILIDENQCAKIIDLGQSKARTLMSTVNQGTPLYNAPEVFADENPQDFRRDVWSLGLILYEMLTGHFFFQSFLQKNKNNLSIVTLKKYVLDRKIQIKLRKKVDPFWTQIIEKMIKKDYKQRKYMHEIQLLFENQYDRLNKRIQSKNLWKTVRDIKLPFLETDLLDETGPMKGSDNHAKVSKVRRYLKYYYEKNRVLVMIGDLFGSKKYPFRYPFMPKILKIATTFLCYEIYLNGVKTIIGDLKHDVVKISKQQKYRLIDFQPPYNLQLQKQMKYYLKFFQEERQIIELKIHQKILPAFKNISFLKEHPISLKNISNPCTNLSITRSRRIQKRRFVDCNIQQTIEKIQQSGKQLGQHYERQTPDFLQEFPNIRDHLSNYNQKTKLSIDRYSELYSTLIQSKYIYQPKADLQKYFYPGDLVIYYLIRVIANLQTQYNWEQINNGSLIIQKDYEMIENIDQQNGRAILLKKIELINHIPITKKYEQK